MSLAFQEKINRKLPDGKKVVFHFWTHNDDLADEEEGCYTCNVKIHDDGRTLSEYYRKFLVRKYNKQHLSKFIEKFCENSEYREQFNIVNDKVLEPHTKGIDEEIRDVVKQLNDMNLKTQYSCQGTKDLFSDRPHRSDGHSVTAYVIFKKSLPKEFVEIAQRYDLFIVCNGFYIRSLKRIYNSFFNNLLEKIVEEYKKLNQPLAVE